MKKKSNVLLLTGALAFIVGVGLVVGTLRGSSDATAADDLSSSVLIAKEAIPPGISGEEAVQKGLVVVKDVDPDKKVEDALSSVTQLKGRILDLGLAPGQQLRASQLRPQTLRGDSITIPAGKQGVAVQVPFVAGGAGYVGAGDRVNVYGNITEGIDGGAVTKLVLQNVEVLDVSTEVAPRVAGEQERQTTTAVTYLLALDANEAENVIYLASNAQLWLALAGDNASLPPTSGRRAGDVLR